MLVLGPEDAHYCWPREVLDYLRKLAHLQEKGDIREVLCNTCTIYAYIISKNDSENFSPK